LKTGPSAGVSVALDYVQMQHGKPSKSNLDKDFAIFRLMHHCLYKYCSGNQCSSYQEIQNPEFSKPLFLSSS